MLKIPTIKCKSFTLRPLNLKDANSVAKYANNKNIAKNLTDAFPSPYGLSDAKSFIKGSLSKDNKSSYHFAVDVFGEAVGVVTIKIKAPHKASFGYWLGEEFWGKGIMTEAIKKVTNFGFKELKLKRIYARVYTHNPASASVLIKNGFEKEGYCKKDEYHMGKILDTIMFAKVK